VEHGVKVMGPDGNAHDAGNHGSQPPRSWIAELLLIGLVIAVTV